MMPVHKFRSLEEMNEFYDRQWLRTGDPKIIRQICYLWEMSEALVQPVGLCIPRGVRKYRSIEEANADRDRWEQERFDRLRELRARERSA
jgi:hypothetical protein